VRVDRLALEGFRNISSAVLEPGPGSNIIYGNNAQGKTNLLEAIWLFCGGRSFRGGREAELAGFGSDITRLHLDFQGEGRGQTADIILGGDKKRVLLNEIKQERASSLSGHFCAVVFSPDQLSMVKQGPEGRRRFLDTSLCQILPKYQKIMEGYERILRQRAHLLRDAASNRGLEEMLEVWDNHLVDYGAYISEVRARYTVRLARAAKDIYGGIASGKEVFHMEYGSTAAEGEPPVTREDWKIRLQKAVRESRGEDLRLGSTTVGPHRDDLSILVNGISARAFASQGQQRSCVLALKLAECALMAESVGEQPVVLLDDVMSELDEGRRSYLLNHLDGKQVFITCCDAGAFASLTGGRVFEIRAGSITPR